MEGTGRYLIEVLFTRFPGGTEENKGHNPEDIRTEFLPNTRLERYRYTSLFGQNCVCVNDAISGEDIMSRTFL